MRLPAFALTSSAVLLLAACTGGSSNAVTFTAHPVAQAAPHGIVFNPDGPLEGLWFDNRTTDNTSGLVEFDTTNFTERFYPTPTSGSQPGSLNHSESGELWFTETKANKIARMDKSRRITEFPVPTKDASPLDITHAADGTMWFVESTAGKLGHITRDGKIAEFTIGDKSSRPTAVIFAPDGAFWFTAVGLGKIGRITTSGHVKYFAGGPGTMTGDITIASDDAFWFGKESSVTRMTADGKLTEFPLPGVKDTGAIFGSRTGGVNMGAIKTDGTGEIVSVAPDGTVTEYPLPEKNLMPAELAQDASGNFWMAVDSFDPSASQKQLFEMRLPKTDK